MTRSGSQPTQAHSRSGFTYLRTDRMNKFYALLKAFNRINIPWLKYVGVLAFYKLNKRYLGLFLDPTQVCNLKCRMCYFSGESHSIPNREQLSAEDYRHMADAIFHRVLRLQIGCGAEPTLYKHLPELIRIGKERGIPNLSLTTNGNLLNYEKLETLVNAGLNELILSAHGLTRQTYEYFMEHARFDAFLRLLDALKKVKATHPDFTLRINYTVNNDNLEDLTLFPQVFDGLKVDVLQIRPIQNIGDSDYQNFNLDKVKSHYDEVFGPLKEYARQHGTMLIIPSKAQLNMLAATEQEPEKSVRSNDHIQDLTYVYAYPGYLWRPDFDFRHDTFEKYSKRTGYARAIWAGILPFIKHPSMESHVTKPLNYTVK